MQVAFIPPRGLERHMFKGDIVMALAQVSYEAYLNTLIDLYQHSMFMIMDNGANEGAQLKDHALLSAASIMHANEMVLPDVLGNSTETIDLAAKYLKKHGTGEMRYMAVAHGTSKEEVYKSIDFFATMPLITTIGLPRLLLGWEYIGRTARLDIANWIKEFHGNRFQIHLLGASSIWPKEPYYVAKYAWHVRSIDTSLPYNYGLRGVNIDKTTDRIDRPEDYFTRVHGMTGLTTIQHNEEVYKEWCNAIPSPTVKSAH